MALPKARNMLSRFRDTEYQQAQISAWQHSELKAYQICNMQQEWTTVCKKILPDQMDEDNLKDLWRDY